MFNLFDGLNKKNPTNYSLAFIAGLTRATDDGSLLEIVQYSPYYFPLNVLLLARDQIIIFYSKGLCSRTGILLA